MAYRGRKPGAKNLIGREACQLILAAFQQMGGVEALAEWGKKNPELFYLGLLGRLIPKVISLDGADAAGGSADGSPEPVVITDLTEALTELERQQEQRYAAEGQPTRLLPVHAENRVSEYMGKEGEDAEGTEQAEG